ncbi:MAG: hypothetical protein AAFV53_02895, partial [Myxococcota bacterium]
PEGREVLIKEGLSERHLEFLANNTSPQDVARITPSLKRRLVKGIKAGRSVDDILEENRQKGIILEGLLGSAAQGLPQKPKTSRNKSTIPQPSPLGVILSRHLLDPDGDDTEFRQLEAITANEYCKENTDFCQDLIKFASQEGPIDRASYAKLMNQYIYNGSPGWVNISGKDRSTLTQLIPKDYAERVQNGEVTDEDRQHDGENLEEIAKAFKAAAKSIMGLISTDTVHKLKRLTPEQRQKNYEQRALFEFKRFKYKAKALKDPKKYNPSNPKYHPFLTDQTPGIFNDIEEARAVATWLILEENAERVG